MENKVIIITGGSDGLGKGTAKVFVEAGWNVVIAARGKEKLERTAQELKTSKGKVLPIPTDVSNAQQVQSMVDQTLNEFGRIDVLINNAAIDYSASIEELTVEQWDQIIGVNLSGVFYTSKAVFPSMKRQNSGYMINISSVAGKKGWPNATAYCASKFALTGFTQALNGEGKPYNIRCSVVYPGGMDTNWHAERNAELLDPKDVGRFLFHMVTQDPRFVVNEAVISPVIERGYP
ncbi:SDR family oxidoreductase [Neobacillus bataviensis]|uniref:SDR family oxidoreductase n=1 Tax=Neobacillus bataviensis TaxID=220685 RepID=UPI001CBF1DF8|nr:SDR family oxidoreductase [Neobacillus bataviensis]